jgi:hypothetical protein
MAEGTERAQTEVRSGVDFSTLVVAALASVVAAIVTSKLWSSGTLISTAMTPVIVSLVKEYLQRPVQKIGQVARAPLVTVRANTTPHGVAAPRRTSAPPEAERRGRVLAPERPDPDEFEPLDTLVPPGEVASTETPYRIYRRRPRRRTWWRVGLVTGIVAFVVAALVLTVPELVGGGSVAGSGRTTLFSHHTGSKTTKSSNDTTTDQNSTSTNGSSSSSDNSSGSSDQGTSGSSSSSSSDQQQSTPSSSGSTSTSPSTSSGGTSSTPSSSPAPSTSAPSTSSGSTSP